MAAHLAWSYSRLKTYKECPKKLLHTAVLKKNHPEYAPYIESKAQRDGKEIDDALTARFNSGTPLPSKFAPYEAMCEVVLAAPGTKLAQVKMAFDAAMQMCGGTEWDRVWLRVIYDLAIVNPAERHAFIWDFKNGMVWLDENQLKLFAATGFLAWPEVDVIDTSYVWLKHGVTSDKTYHRRDAAEMWSELLPDVERMQVSYKTDHWPATPSKSACKYCQLNALGKCPAAAVKFGG